MSPQLPLHSKPLGGQKIWRVSGAKLEVEKNRRWRQKGCDRNLFASLGQKIWRRRFWLAFILLYFSATATVLSRRCFLFEPVWEMWTIYNRNCCVCIWLTRRIRNQRAIAKSIESNNIASGIFWCQVIGALTESF